MNFNDTTSIFVKDLFRLRKVGSKPKDESMDNSVFHRQPAVDETGVFGLRSSVFGLPSSVFDLRSLVFRLRSSIFDLRSSVFDLRSSVFKPFYLLFNSTKLVV